MLSGNSEAMAPNTRVKLTVPAWMVAVYTIRLDSLDFHS